MPTRSGDHEAIPPDFDFADAEVAKSLWPTLAKLRECPAVHSDRYGGYWALPRFEDVRRESNAHDHLSAAAGATIPSMDNPFPAVPLESDPPEHTAFRKVLLPLFKPQAVRDMEDGIRSIVDDLIDQFYPRGEADLMSEFAHKVAPRVIALLLGLSYSEMDEIVTATEQMMVCAASGDDHGKLTAIESIDETLRATARKRREEPKDDLTTLLVDAEIDGKRLDEGLVVGMLHLVALAGHTTTIHGIGSMLYLIVAHPDARERILNDRTLVDSTIDESLRYEPPILMMGRSAVQDFDVDGVRIPAGDRVGLMFGSANRDQSVFPEADEFRIDRRPNRHLAFGSGAHRCIGEHLARLEMRVALQRILDRVPNYQIKQGAELEWTPSFNRGLTSLPVVF